MQKKTSRSKIKVRKWVDTPDFRNYEKFVCDWHYFLLDVQEVLYESEDSDLIRNLNMYVVNQFYGNLMMRNGIFMSSFTRDLRREKNS